MHPPLQLIIVGNSRSNLAHKACITYCQRWMRRELWWAWKTMYWWEKRYPFFFSSFSKTCSCLPNFKTYREFFHKSYLEHFFFHPVKTVTMKEFKLQKFHIFYPICYGPNICWLLYPHTFGGKLVAPTVKKFLQISEL